MQPRNETEVIEMPSADPPPSISSHPAQRGPTAVRFVNRYSRQVPKTTVSNVDARSAISVARLFFSEKHHSITKSALNAQRVSPGKCTEIYRAYEVA